MANYRSMYAVLCKAIDDAITSLAAIPSAKCIVSDSCSALLEAEEIYGNTAQKITEQNIQKSDIIKTWINR